MAGETSHSGTVPSAEVPWPEWLIDIIEEQHERLTWKTEKQAYEQRTRLMTRADKTQRESNQECFDPLVVSLGPFHHGKPGLELMESYKKVSAVWFLSLATGKPAIDITETESNVYQKFNEKVNFSPRDCYADHESFYESKYQSASEDLMPMMFLDGCFILHFIHRVVNGWSDDLSNISPHLSQTHIVRDMFLLENQIPYPILRALMSLLPLPNNPQSWIMEFIFTVFLPPFTFDFSPIGFWRALVALFLLFPSPPWEHYLSSIWDSLYDEGNEPLHLLDLLRAVLVGAGASPDSSHGSGNWNYNSRPIAELKATGIQVSRGNSWMLKEVKFKSRLINSHLVLPQTVVDDSTETRLLNLLAYENCHDGPLDRTVTSYICFLDSLIQNADDVKELQRENILLNRLGSNEEVDKLFRKLAANLSPDYNVYTDVINGIGEHYTGHFLRERAQIGQRMSQFIRTYFTNYFSPPWTVISVIAASLLLFLTLLQTIYTTLSFYET